MRAILVAAVMMLAAPAWAQESSVILRCESEGAATFVRIGVDDFRVLPAAETTRAEGWGENLCAAGGAHCALASAARTFTYSSGRSITETYDWGAGAWTAMTQISGAAGPCAEAADPLANQ